MKEREIFFIQKSFPAGNRELEIVLKNQMRKEALIYLAGEIEDMDDYIMLQDYRDITDEEDSEKGLESVEYRVELRKIG